MDIEDLRTTLHQVVDNTIDQWFKSQPDQTMPDPLPEEQSEAEEPKRVLPTDKRVVRTKTSGDRVFLLDEEKRTRQWVTTPSLLEELGFKLEDVGEVEESELLKYQMATPLHKT